MLARLVATLLAVVAVGAAPAPPATAAGTKCVALVVDFTTLGGSVSTSCVTAPTSATGSDVLVKGHHTVTFDPRYGNDFICAIDGRPASGCHGNDDTHYWVYYHRAPGGSSWHLSQEGAGTYKPANASTEGWVYDDGATSAPQPRNVPYRNICTTTATPTQTATPTPARTSTPTAAPTRVPAPAQGATATATATATAPARTPAATAHSAAVLATAAVLSPSATPTPTTTSIASAAVHSRHSSFPWGLLVAAVAALGVGSAAAVRFRRSSG